MDLMHCNFKWKYLYNCWILQNFGDRRCWAKLLFSGFICNFLFLISSDFGGSGTLNGIFLIFSCIIWFPWVLACLFLSVLEGSGSCLLHWVANSAISSAIAEKAVCGTDLCNVGANLCPSCAQSSEDALWPVIL